MKEVQELLDRLTARTAELQDAVSNDMSIQEGECPAGAFGMVHNHICLAKELLLYYRLLWGKGTVRQYVVGPWGKASIEARKTSRARLSEGERKELVEENRLRVTGILGQTYISSLSSLEFCAKGFIAKGTHPTLQRQLARKKRVYLRTIMEKSVKLGIISKHEGKDWSALIDVRNNLVHNNAISERNLTRRIGAVSINLRRKQMMIGRLDLFPLLIGETVERFHTWIKGVLVR